MWRNITRLRAQWLVLRMTGAGLLLATGAIHLDLYLTGYRTIPTIGWLFLLQLITAFGLGVVVLISRSRLLAAAGAGFAVATLGGYLLSLRIGLFGFREVRTTAGIAAGVIEVVTFASLAAFSVRPSEEHGPAAMPARDNLIDSIRAAIPAARWTAAGLSIVAAVLLGLSLAAPGPTSTGSTSSSALVKLATIKGVSVLTNARGLTLYWFVPDTQGKSTCYGTCAVYWPPVLGNPVPSRSVTGKLGTRRRSGGGVQVTYNHHPLYTYVGDSSPGQANGDNVNLNGGLWHEMTESG